MRVVELGEAEGRLAQLAVLFLRMGQPLHQTVLVHIFDAATAFAGVEERFLDGALGSAYSTGIRIIHAHLSLARSIVIEGGIIHDIRMVGWGKWSVHGRRTCKLFSALSVSDGGDGKASLQPSLHRCHSAGIAKLNNIDHSPISSE